MTDVPPLKLPVDFGLHLLEDSRNNNVKLIINDETRNFEIRTSSLMLQIHCEEINNLGVLPDPKNPLQFSLNLTEFGSETVVAFVEALYCGKPKITCVNLREINRISHHFGVSWMIKKCSEFVAQTIDINGSRTDKESMLYLKSLFDEVVFAYKSFETDEWIAIFRKHLEKTESKELFMQTYLEELGSDHDSNVDHIDCLFNMAGSEHSAFIDYIYKRAKQNANLPRSHVMLLKKCDLVGCMSGNASPIVDLFEILLESKSTPNWTTFDKLYRDACGEFLRAQTPILSPAKPTSSSNVDLVGAYIEQAAPKRQKTETIRIRQFKNLFNEASLSTGKALSMSDELDEVPFHNLYMAMEYLSFKKCSNFQDVIRKLEYLAKVDKLEPIQPKFFDSYVTIGSQADQQILKSRLVAYSDYRLKVVCPDVSVDEFFTKEKIYKIILPGQPIHVWPNEWKVSVKVSALDSTSDQDFSIMLMLDDSQYHDGVNCYKEYRNIHFVMELFKNDWCKKDCWKNLNVTWQGKPEMSGDEEVRWGEHVLNFEDRIRMVLYFSNPKVHFAECHKKNNGRATVGFVMQPGNDTVLGVRWDAESVGPADPFETNPNYE